jgi:hypothetical protein
LDNEFVISPQAYVLTATPLALALAAMQFPEA